MRIWLGLILIAYTKFHEKQTFKKVIIDKANLNYYPPDHIKTGYYEKSVRSEFS
jgi:hypothetical protein